VFLVKPQFEWESPPEGFDGVVRDEGDRRAIVAQLIGDLEGEGVLAARACDSPIRGRRGNREVLLLLHRQQAVLPVQPQLAVDLDALWKE
jgi:23S rRNA (cytidine1920-2'-O)/16S rRNA (cytidine1409-2'-O)-methyltransferase